MVIHNSSALSLGSVLWLLPATNFSGLPRCALFIAHFKISTHFTLYICLEIPVIITEQNPRADSHILLRRSSIDHSPWKDRRSHRLVFTRPASPRHRRKKALFSMATGGSFPAPVHNFKSLVLMVIEVRCAVSEDNPCS